MTWNLRHLRIVRAAAAAGSLTAAAAAARVSQPAASLALARVEAAAGVPLFRRGPRGLWPTPQGAAFAARLERLFARLDPALAEIAPGLHATATAARLEALVAVAEAGGFAPAARRLGLAEPTVHRAVGALERAAGRALFVRTAAGVLPTRRGEALAGAVRLAFAELDQALAEVAEAGGRIVVGALPLARSVVLPEALAAFAARPGAAVTVLDGPYDAMLAGLRAGTIDLILGALRDPPPGPDVAQDRLFFDTLCLVARPGHPILAGPAPDAHALARWPWAAPRAGTPARAQFDALFARADLRPPEGVIDCGSILLMRELLARSDRLGCISGLQAAAEVRHGLLAALPLPDPPPPRPIGLTTRAGWLPTPAQADLIAAIRAAAAALQPESAP